MVEWQIFVSLLSNPFVFWLSFKKTKVRFFRFLKYKITIEPVRFASLILFVEITTLASLRKIHSLKLIASLHFDIWIP